MKRIYIITALLLFSFLTGGIVSGQETKKEQHIKIVTVDKAGNKVEIDTLIKDGAIMDTIVLKDGKVIVLGAHDPMAGKLIHAGEGKGQIFVTVSSDTDKDKGEKGEKGKTVIVSRSSGGATDSGFTIITDDGEVKDGKTVYIKDGKTIVKEGEGGKIITMTSRNDSEKDDRIVYINEGKVITRAGEKTFDVKVITDDEGNTVEKTKYVIAKDGMVITIEGSDEAKVKEMIKEVESKLGVVKADVNTKPVVKEETKKTTKK